MNEVIEATDLFIRYQQAKLKHDYRMALSLNGQVYDILWDLYSKSSGEMRDLLKDELEAIVEGGQELAGMLNLTQQNAQEENK